MLFGAGTPFAKLLLDTVNPWMMASLLYLGSGIGLSALRLLKRTPPVRPEHGDWPWLAGAIFAGGVVGPVLLMFGLSGMPASGASLLLNAEGVFTAALAWFVFRENVDRRIALGMAAIVAGAVVLSWPGEARFGEALPALAVVGACFAWALDNNLTRKVSLADATWIAALKGWVAGAVNLAIAAATVKVWPAWWTLIAAGTVGWLAYGVSLALFVIGLRHLGAARTGAYFSVAPFVGAVIALPLLAEAITPQLAIAGGLMAFGVWLHLTERHEHWHTHEPLVHTHEHDHDEHHRHEHDFPVAPGTRHTHEHRHEPLTHAHPHFPDAHHRHSH
jgi:drug/metabolite transporter (DMT)-like permease